MHFKNIDGQILTVVCLLLLIISCKNKRNFGIGSSADEFFVFEVLPIIQSKCLSCHGDNLEKIEGGLDLRTARSMAKGGDNYADLITPGRPEYSPLYQALTREDPDFSMPPKDRDALTEAEVQAFYQWIVAGAPWPDQDEQKRIAATSGPKGNTRIKVETSGGQTAHWEQRYYRAADLWAYRRRDSIDIPAKYADKHPIDAFINERLEGLQLSPADEAGPAQLLKRVYYDLLGLPPTTTELKTFLASEQSDAYEQLIDNLLARPQYGEQWARHWLDVARYADSDGFSNDYLRPNAWRYRDYVIRSFNSDKPYDQFILEQLAGDELYPDNPEMLVATGFLRMGPWEHTGMSVAAETRQYFLDDVTNIVGETFLATPLNCARCHDHKYDPIPTKDYYKIQAVFASTQLAQRPAALLVNENVNRLSEEKERIQAWIARTEEEADQIAQKEESAVRGWFSERGRKYLPKNERRKLEPDRQPPRYYGLTNADLGYRKVLQKRNQILRRNLDRFEPWAYSVYNGPLRTVHSASTMRMPENINGAPQPLYVLQGGSVYAPGEEVAPGVLSVLHHLDSTISPDFHALSQISGDMQGRRLAFAKWLTHADNPLTARVMVNRIWQHHFGNALVQNPNNFGASGKKPTHPELLDWLANEFVKHDYSVKYLHKLIMTSEVYKRASEHSDMQKIRLKDPENNYLSYFSPRRLEAEEIRDAMLLISGELNLEMGGIPIRPEIPLEVALQPRHTMGSVAPAYQPSRTPAERNRRSIYAERKRAVENPMLQVFNQNTSDLSCEQRESSTIVSQAFTLLNSPNTSSRALALAKNIVKNISDQSSQIAKANEVILQRDPSQLELKSALEFIAEAVHFHSENDPVKIEYPAHVEHEMFEEMTGESFVFREHLDIYEKYVPDTQYAEVDVQTRALADYLVVLFNTNEFIYVY
jgi:hypothetical protein